MAAILDTITKKPKWNEKIFVDSIVENWTRELVAQGIQPKHIEVAINVLKAMASSGLKTVTMQKAAHEFEWRQITDAEAAIPLPDIPIPPAPRSPLPRSPGRFPPTTVTAVPMSPFALPRDPPAFTVPAPPPRIVSRPPAQRMTKLDKPLKGDYDLKFTWHIFEVDCKCKCIHCNSDSRHDDDDDDEYTEKDLVCKCAPRTIPERELFTKNLLTFQTNRDFAFKMRVQRCARLLEAGEPDWHPWTNDQVRDLIHPSMYCYVKGVTKVTHELKGTNPVQWLPADVTVTDGVPKFVSPICGLDPELGITGVLEEALQMFIPSITRCCENHLVVEDDALDMEHLQVIVKMANTELTPEKPEYPGGSWHLEGIPSEHIAVTCIYYYHVDNIEGGKLHVRIPVTEDHESDLKYDQNEHDTVITHYSINPETGVQHLGSVPTEEDTCLTFPNFVQHRVSPFKLIDPTKPGSRKILLFWVIRPDVRILSTDDVVAQPMTVEDARVYREILMFQRKNDVDERSGVYTRELSLCEH